MEVKWRNKDIVRNWCVYPFVLGIVIMIISCYTLSKKNDTYADYQLVGCYKQMEGSNKRGFIERHYCDFQKLSSDSVFTQLYKPYTYNVMAKHKVGTLFTLVDHEQNYYWIIVNFIFITLHIGWFITFLLCSAIEGKFIWDEYNNKLL